MYWKTGKEVQFNYLLGKTLTKIEKVNKHGDELKFYLENGEIAVLFHSQSCCESVIIEDINGSLEDLVGSPITLAEEATSKNITPLGVPQAQSYESCYTWTFYRLATVKGYVDIRWLGSSNGYYSESVDFMIEGKNENTGL